MEQPEALNVLRTVWSATGQSEDELDEAFGPHGSHKHGPGKSCKNMRNVGFNGDDEDLRAAWRGRLEREGKLARSGTLADLVFGVTSDAVAVQDPH
ncbi:MAG TPA: hypothetical protein VH089_25755 [Streptosporangiaceae bacterium]|jgi:hypothetical protein|nr:hypothetical protein [Streptosporangiaceae bacterium]